MILIDLSRDIEHKMQVLPNHPQVIVTNFATHDEVRTVDGYGFSSATMAIVMGDHAGTHVDAPKHFNADPKAASIDEVPLENFFTEAVCLDLSHKPLKSDISIEDLEKAIEAAGVEIKPKDTVLLHMDFYRRTHGTPAFITDFPGLTKELATWLGKKGIGMFGVEAVSPGRTGRSNFEVHHVCRDMGFTHMEGLVNLDKLVGKGRFKFIGFPIKIKGGTGAPIRAVAWLDGYDDPASASALSPGLTLRSIAKQCVSKGEAAPDLGFTRDRYLRNASRVNPTCGLRDGASRLLGMRRR